MLVKGAPVVNERKILICNLHYKQIIIACLVCIFQPMSQNLIGKIIYIVILYEIIVSFKIHHGRVVVSSTTQVYMQPVLISIYLNHLYVCFCFEETYRCICIFYHFSTMR